MGSLTRSKSVVSALGLLFVMAGNPLAAPVLDQKNDSFPTNYTSFNGGSSSLTWQQGVTAGLSGTLQSIDLYFVDENLAQGINFFLNIGAPWQSDANDFSANITLVAGWNSIDVLSAGISLAAGDRFAIGLHGLGTLFAPSFLGTDDLYTGGAVYLNGAIYTREVDINFRTYMNVVDGPTIPEPSTLALLGLGLAGLATSRRRR